MSNISRIPGMILKDHEFSVPLDHEKPDGDKINLFAREVVSVGKEEKNLPWLLYLQGGPGFASPRPFSKSGWVKRALDDYRILFMDQRGTGRSTPINYQTLACFQSPQEQADYLKNFRADSMVKDAEFIRKKLCGEKERWSVIGQSYGGFIIGTYLSFAPQGLKQAIFTGGLPPIGAHADDIYRSLYRRVIRQNRHYYERYPDDRKRIKEIADFLRSNEVEMPGGGILTVRRFQALGLTFGFSSGFEQVHYLVENAFVRGANGMELSYNFLRGIEKTEPFESNPVYTILHESIYCEREASNWSAHRMREEFPEFDQDRRDSLYFTGEMIFPWMFEDYKYLKPLREAADILAKYKDWTSLYDIRILKENNVPCSAIVYYDDMYVERIFSENAIDIIKRIKTWVTNEYDHGGLSTDGENVLDRLLRMLGGEI